MAESEQTPSVEMMAQDESVGQGQPEQPTAHDSESATAVAMIDTPAAETPAESAIVAEGTENSVTEAVIDTKEQTPEGAGIEAGISDVVRPKIADLPAENTVDPSAVVEVESTEVAVEDASTAIESETSASQDVADEGVSDTERPENVKDIPLDSPPTPVDANAENEAEENQAIKPLVISPIPVQSAFLPVQSAQNRPGYTLRGLF